MLFSLFLITLGLIVGIISGMLGLGGGVLTVPALVALAPDLGFKAYSMQVATGISAFTSLFATTSGFITHFKKGFISLNFIKPIILISLVASFCGSIVSSFVPDKYLQWLFVLVLVVILIIEIFAPRPSLNNRNEIDDDSNATPASLNDPQVQLVTGITSFLVSHIGIGGSILFIPYLLRFRNMPIRYAIGTGTCFVLFNAVGLIAGKMLLNLVAWHEILMVATSAVIGGQIGSKLSHKMPASWLRTLIVVMMSMTIIKLVINLVH